MLKFLLRLVNQYIFLRLLRSRGRCASITGLYFLEFSLRSALTSLLDFFSALRQRKLSHGDFAWLTDLQRLRDDRLISADS